MTFLRRREPHQQLVLVLEGITRSLPGIVSSRLFSRSAQIDVARLLENRCLLFMTA